MVDTIVDFAHEFEYSPQRFFSCPHCPLDMVDMVDTIVDFAHEFEYSPQRFFSCPHCPLDMVDATFDFV